MMLLPLLTRWTVGIVLFVAAVYYAQQQYDVSVVQPRNSWWTEVQQQNARTVAELWDKACAETLEERLEWAQTCATKPKPHKELSTPPSPSDMHVFVGGATVLCMMLVLTLWMTRAWNIYREANRTKLKVR